MNIAIQLLDDNNALSLPCILTTKALDICKAFTLFKPLPLLLKSSEFNTTVFLRTLLENQHYLDAIQFIAHGLAKKEAIAWAHQCILHVLDDNNSKLNAVEEWFVDPTPEKCTPFGEQSDTFDDPLTWLQLAIFWNGPNISTHKDVNVKPSMELTGHGVSTSIILAAVGHDQKSITELHEFFIEHGVKRALGIAPEVVNKTERT